MKVRLFCASMAIVGVSSLCAASSAEVAGDAYKAAVEAYKKADYKSAAQLFHELVANGKGSATAWLYLGHSYAATNDKTRAISVYRSLVAKFPTSPEAVHAQFALRKIKPLPVATPTKPAETASAAAPPPANAKKNKFIDKLTCYPPKFGHQPISQGTLTTVRDVILNLPPQVISILDDNNATFTLAPNIIDKWPGSGDGMKPGSSTTTMGEEVGRTYGRDIHVYERAQVRGTTDLKDIRPAHEIKDTSLHEIGHAVDDCLGSISKDPSFAAMLKLDVNDMPDDVRSQLNYYIDPGEACAETVAGLIGKNDNDAQMVSQSMPRVKRFVKAKLKL